MISTDADIPWATEDAALAAENLMLAARAAGLGSCWIGFANLHKAATADGALNTKTKELIALGIAVASQCEPCIAYHVHDALRAGASRAEMLEALGVAVMMGGGPAAMYACDAFVALEQFESANKASDQS